MEITGNQLSISVISHIFTIRGEKMKKTYKPLKISKSEKNTEHPCFTKHSKGGMLCKVPKNTSCRV